tara:strand:+ start:131 stop:586 length:456 start_codon:yes stop_codon:yes gene_type:complete
MNKRGSIIEQAGLNLFRGVLFLFVLIAIYVIMADHLSREEDIGGQQVDLMLVRALHDDCFGDGRSYDVDLDKFEQDRLDECMRIEDKYGVKVSLFEGSKEIKEAVYVNKNLVIVRLAGCQNTKAVDCFYRDVLVNSEDKGLKLSLEVVREK